MRLFSIADIVENAAVIAAAIRSCSMYGGIGISISFRVGGLSSFWLVEPSPFKFALVGFHEAIHINRLNTMSGTDNSHMGIGYYR